MLKNKVMAGIFVFITPRSTVRSRPPLVANPVHDFGTLRFRIHNARFSAGVAWGLVVMVLLLGIAATVMIRKRVVS